MNKVTLKRPVVFLIALCFVTGLVLALAMRL